MTVVCCDVESLSTKTYTGFWRGHRMLRSQRFSTSVDKQLDDRNDDDNVDDHELNKYSAFLNNFDIDLLTFFFFFTIHAKLCLL